MAATQHDLRTRLYRFFIFANTRFVYGFCCFLDLGSFRYVQSSGRVKKYHTPWQWVVMAVFIKLLLFALEAPYIFMCGGMMYFFFFKDSSEFNDNTTYQWMQMLAEEAMAFVSTARLIYISHNSTYCEFFTLAVNKVLEMHRLVRRIFGDAQLYLDDSLLVVFLLKVFLTFHHIAAQYTPTEKHFILVRYHTLNVILFEIFYSAYFLYQLLLLGWQRSLLGFLDTHLALKQPRRALSLKCHKRITCVFSIYAKIAKIHLLVSSAWLKVSSMLFICVYYTAHESTYTVYCLFSWSQLSIMKRAEVLLLKKMGSFLYPLVGILLMGMASDRMKFLEAQLCERIFLVELVHAKEDTKISNEVSRLISCKVGFIRFFQDILIICSVILE
ncbi:uncharacterized protein CG1339 [Drosophila ananassae]|uniref:uncharacterized protein CG1339 n=1 Tax=Drosophila ananassae TaxID=7217 RepID=UPI0013A5E1E6|nr:uncharacterized protein CG1339 [Drosophila ananassae]